MKSFRKIFVAIMLVLLWTDLHAQPTDPAAPTAPLPVLSRKLSVDQMSANATELEAAVRVDDKHVLHLQALARKDKDVIKLACINDKYIQLKAEANIFDAQKRDLLGSLDKDTRFTTYDSMAGAAAAVRKAREEAERCMGEPELGEQSTNSFTAPDIPDDPTTDLPFDDFPGLTVEPPVYASPYS